MNSQSEYTPFQRFTRLLKPDQKEITNVYIYSLFKGLVGIALPLGIQAIVNFIQGGKISASWILLVSLVIGSVALNGLMQILQLKITESLQQKIFTRAAFEFTYRIPKIKLDALLREYAPELMNRFFDIVSIQKGLPKILIDFSTAVLHIIFGLTLLCLYHPFFIIFCVLLVAMIYVLVRYTFKKGLDTSLEESKYKYQLVHWLEEVARASVIFKLSGEASHTLDKTNEHTRRYLQARDSHFKILVKQYSFMVVYKVFIAAGMLIIGSILVMEGQMNIGQFVASEIILLLIMNAFEKVILSLDNVYDILTALEKIGQVTDLPLDSNEGIKFEPKADDKGVDIEMNDVKFSYPGQKSLALKGVNFKAFKGEKIMISGPNGAGKSSMLAVLSGLYDQDEGQILINEIPKATINLNSLRFHSGEFLGNEILFEGTIFDNICLGRSVDLDFLSEILLGVGLKEFINELPQGINTLLGTKGIQPNRSITQKLIVARTIAAKPKLLLLEDSLQYLDNTDRKRVIDFLTDAERPWTMIVVSNDKYMARNCDQVFLIEDGRIQSQERSNSGDNA